METGVLRRFVRAMGPAEPSSGLAIVLGKPGPTRLATP